MYSKYIGFVDKIQFYPRKAFLSFVVACLLVSPACKKALPQELDKYVPGINKEMYEDKEFMRYLLFHAMQGELLYHEDNKKLMEALLNDKDQVLELYLNSKLKADYFFYLRHPVRDPAEIIRARDYNVSARLSRIPILGNNVIDRDQTIGIIRAVEKYLHNETLDAREQYCLDNFEQLFFYNGNYFNHQTDYILRELFTKPQSRDSYNYFRDLYLGKHYGDARIDDYDNLSSMTVEIEELTSEYLKKRKLDMLANELHARQKARDITLVLSFLVSSLLFMSGVKITAFYRRRKLYEQVMELNNKIIGCEMQLRNIERQENIDQTRLRTKTEELDALFTKLAQLFKKYRGTTITSINVGDDQQEVLDLLGDMLKNPQEVYITDAHVWDEQDGRLMESFIKILLEKKATTIHLILGAPRHSNGKDKEVSARKEVFARNVALLQAYPQVEVKIVQTELFHDREIETEKGNMHLGRSISELLKIKPNRLKKLTVSYVPKYKKMKPGFQPQSGYIRLLLEESRLYGNVLSD